MPIPLDKRRLISWLRSEPSRITSRRYEIDFEALDVKSLRELVRMLRDLGDERDAAVDRARREPWRG